MGTRLGLEVTLFGAIGRSAVDSVGSEEKSSVYLIGDGGNPQATVEVELDEGAKGVGGSWIDSDLVTRMSLKTRPTGSSARFRSRLFPGRDFIPQEEVEVRLRFNPAGVEVTLMCYVLPASQDSGQQSDVIIGDHHLRKFGIWDLFCFAYFVLPCGKKQKVI